jgi:hypothetical protein
MITTTILHNHPLRRRCFYPTINEYESFYIDEDTNDVELRTVIRPRVI